MIILLFREPVLLITYGEDGFIKDIENLILKMKNLNKMTME